MLTSCLGPEQLGRVRGVSSYRGWKHAWPQFADLYRKRRRPCSDDDMQAMKSQLRVEITRDVFFFFASQGFELQRVSSRNPSPRNPSPASGRKSSCVSASKAEHEDNIAGNDPLQTQIEMEHALDRHQMEMEHGGGTPDNHEDIIPSPEVDSIDLLTKPTLCSLIIYNGGHQMEIAWGQVYPQQTKLHIVPILYGHAVVKVEFVHPRYRDYMLQPPPNDETTLLGQAIKLSIQGSSGRGLVLY